jgi:hypothetical protein
MYVVIYKNLAKNAPIEKHRKRCYIGIGLSYNVLVDIKAHRHKQVLGVLPLKRLINTVAFQSNTIFKMA